ncbi:MAG: SEL1-like repeat protein [Proteobacteria bacterium]|nr:SEL1-like repeat protein [Pseudomonadota bacterium]
MSNPEMSAERRRGQEPLESGDDGRAELKSMLDTISAQLQDADRRHMAALSEMQDRISVMGREADLLRARIPDEFVPAFEQIEAGIGELAHRLADAGQDVHRTAAHTPPRRSTGASKYGSHVDPFDVVGSVTEDAVDPWDRQSAEALTSVYETAGSDIASHRRAPSDARGTDAATSHIDEAWLQSRFAEIARGIEYSLAHVKPELGISELGDRFDQFERQFGKLFAGVATHDDLAGVRQIEAHMSAVVNQLEHTQDQLQRLNTIEAQIASISKTLAEMQSARTGEKSLEDIDAIARAVAEETALRFVLSRENDEHSAADELRPLIEQLRSENRQSDEQTAVLLDTMQQAMVRLLDRVDAIDVTQQPVPPPFEPGSAPNIVGPATFGENVGYGQDWMAGGYDVASDAMGAGAPSAMPAPSAHFSPSDDDLGESLDEAARRSERLRQEFVADARRARMRLSGESDDIRAAVPPMLSSSAAATHPSGSRPIRPSAAPVKNTSGPSAPSPRLMLVAALVLIALAGLWYTFGFGGYRGEPAAVQEIAPGSSPSGTSDAAKAAPAASGPSVDRPSAPSSDVNGPRGDAASSNEANGQKTASDDAAQHPKIALPMLGVAVDLGEPISEAEMQTARRHQAMAAMSGELGTAMTRPGEAAAVPKSMIPSESETEGTVSPDRTSAAMDSGSKSSPLDLPAATIGPLSLRLAAANGDSSAEFAVGSRLASGQGVPQNFKEAAKWYQRSADQGFAQAEYRLGTLYERGLGLKPDRDQATQWYERAARQGNVNAMHNLAVLSANQIDQSPDYVTAAQWFEEAAKRGLPDSQFNLAILYENGLGVKRDMTAAFMWISLAARQGDTDAIRRRDILRGKLTAQEIADANRMVDAWRPTPTDRTINDALAASELWKKNPKNGVNG